jgi:chaperonin GroEL
MSQLYCKNRERTIKNAASIAGLMLTTEALVADMKEDDKKSAAGGGGGMPGGGGMGGMY